MFDELATTDAVASLTEDDGELVNEGDTEKDAEGEGDSDGEGSPD